MVQNSMKSVRIVLVETSHPGNIGASARAMKNMGLSHLVLVNPVIYPHADATVRAAGADDVLANARQVMSLDEALSGCQLVLGTSARNRALPWPLINPRESAQLAIEQAGESDVALVFGRERTGLTNDELAKCHYHVNIPTNPNFSSLNLAAAVQVLTYELKMALLAGEVAPQGPKPDSVLATADEMAGFIQHLHVTLEAIDFLTDNSSKKLMQRLQRLFTRARVEQTELNILRGILSAMQKKL